MTLHLDSHDDCHTMSAISRWRSTSQSSLITSLGVNSKEVPPPTTMPYNRDEVITSVTNYYTFLVNHLNFNDSNLKKPPPTGWPHINPTQCAFLRKPDQVIELLRYLPYLDCYPVAEDVIRKEIWPHAVCADYSDEALIKSLSDIGDQDYFEPIEEVAENCPWEPLKDRNRDVVAIAKPECVGSFPSSRNGRIWSP